MLKWIFLASSFLMMILQTQAAPLTLHLSRQIHQHSKMPFLTFEGPGPFDTYLSMNLPAGPVEKVLQQLQQNYNPLLKGRGEAHITVITPPEYHQVLRTKISIAEINQLARELHLQDQPFEVLGLGSARVGQEEAFFLLVKAPGLLKIRKEIAALFSARGGHLQNFVPEHFYPHITVGFVNRDLHESDGVIKDPEHSLDPRFRLEIK